MVILSQSAFMRPASMNDTNIALKIVIQGYMTFKSVKWEKNKARTGDYPYGLYMLII